MFYIYDVVKKKHTHILDKYIMDARVFYGKLAISLRNSEWSKTNSFLEGLRPDTLINAMHFIIIKSEEVSKKISTIIKQYKLKKAQEQEKIRGETETEQIKIQKEERKLKKIIGMSQELNDKIILLDKEKNAYNASIKSVDTLLIEAGKIEGELEKTIKRGITNFKDPDIIIKANRIIELRENAKIEIKKSSVIFTNLQPIYKRLVHIHTYLSTHTGIEEIKFEEIDELYTKPELMSNETALELIDRIKNNSTKEEQVREPVVGRYNKSNTTIPASGKGGANKIKVKKPLKKPVKKPLKKPVVKSTTKKVATTRSRK